MADTTIPALAPGAPARRRSAPLSLLLLLPGVLFSLCFFIVPLAFMFASSLTATEDGATVFTFANYAKVLGDWFYWEVLLRTVRIAAFATLLTLLLGYPAALYLYFSQSRWRRVFLFIIVSPLFVSVIVRTYGWIVLLAPSGVFNTLWPGEGRLRLLNTEGAVVIGLMHIYIPFMVMAINAALIKVDRRLLSAAASLGASNLRIFRDILVPPSMPGIVSGCVIVFSIAMTAFSTPVLLGGAQNKTMSYLVYQQSMLLGDWHTGSALAFFLLVITVAVVRILSRLGDRQGLTGAIQ